MLNSKNTSKFLVYMCLFTICCFYCCRFQHKNSHETALKKFRKMTEETLPRVVSLTGIQKGEPVEVTMLSKAELGRFFDSLFPLEYPNDELRKRGQCFIEIGLLSRGYDLADGFLDLLQEQAGAVYDYRSKTLKGIYDLAPERRRAVDDKMIVSHELTHALQDRCVDFNREMPNTLKNIDYEYSFGALIEGMASAVMIAYAQNLALNDLPDLKTFWRSNFAQGTGSALVGSPEYLREKLISPYAEGGAFIQSWLKANPNLTVNELFAKMPSSSEQVLHFDKYTEGDQPAKIDISKTKVVLPDDWDLFYANTLGEFDLLKLFQTRPETESRADQIAAGWDGCQFEAYRDKSGKTILFGSSVWDSEKDAEEFCEGLGSALEGFRDQKDFDLVRNKSRVNFVIGSNDAKMRKTILRSLSQITPK